MSGRKLLAAALAAGLTPPPVYTEERRNLALDPRAAAPAAIGVGRWTNNSGSGTYSVVDGVETPMAGLTTVRRVTLTSATFVSRGWGLIGVVTGQPQAAALLPVTPGEPVTVSLWIRWTTASQGILDASLRVRYSGNGTTWLGSMSEEWHEVTAGQWSRIDATLVPPAGAAYLAVSFVSVGDDMAIGDTLDATALLIERSAVLGDYFDWSCSPDPALLPSLDDLTGESVLSSVVQPPLAWQIVSDARQLDSVRKPGAIVLWTQTRRKAPALGLSWFADEVTLQVLTAADKPDVIEDDLDDLLWQVQQALEPLTAFAWETADRVAVQDAFHGWQMTITCCWKHDPEPDQEQEQ